MKNIICIVAAFLAVGAHAQNMEGKLSAPMNTKEGKVIYERTTQLGGARFMGRGGNIPPEMQAQLDKMPKSRTDQFELLFTPQHSLYQYLPNAADESGGATTISGGGMTIQMRAPGINDVTYVDFAKGTRSEQREVMEKNYVVVDTPARLQWKLSDETKPILNFIARKASATTINQVPTLTMENGEMKREMRSDTAKIVAWYTTDVPVPAGPAYAGQLPGLILELDMNNGRSVTRAIEFSPKVSANKIKEPNDGKKLSAAEFTAERERIMEEMRKNMPAGNRIRMQ